MRDFPGGTVGKNPPASAGDVGWSLGWEDPLEKEMATHSSMLAWKIPWTEEPGRLQVHGGQSQAWLSDSTVNSREVYSTPQSLHFYVISLSLIWDFVLCLESFHFHVFSCFFPLLLGTFIFKKTTRTCRQAQWTPMYVTSKHYLNETALPPSWNHWLLTSCSCGWCLWTCNWPVYFQATKVRSLHWVNPPPGCLAFCALDFIIREASAHGLA